MKVLHINFSDSHGGAAKAAYRLHETMLKFGIDSKMLVVQKRNASSFVDTPHQKSYKIRNNFFRLINKIENTLSGTIGSWSNNMFGLDLCKHPDVLNADIIYLHWINANTLSLKSIQKLLSTRKQIFLFSHDMWYMTGGCHHSMGCDKFTDICGNCKFKTKRFPLIDIANIQFKKKQEVFKDCKNLTILTPSVWLKQCFLQSIIFRNYPIITARNILDTELFKPLDKIYCRKELQLPIKKKIVGFGAESVRNIYKGWNDLLEAIKNIKTSDVEFVIFGRLEKEFIEQYGNDSRFHFLGSISDEQTMIKMYNACDILVCPSLAENFPNVIIEAMSCGIPVVANNVGGIPEIINHKKTGYLSVPHDIESLTKGIEWSLNHDFDQQDIRTSIINLCSVKNFEKLHNYLFK